MLSDKYKKQALARLKMMSVEEVEKILIAIGSVKVKTQERDLKMLIVSQCGTGFFNSAHFVGAWIEDYENKRFLLKAAFDRDVAILGFYDSKDRAMNALNKMMNRLKKEWRPTTDIYQIESGEDGDND